MAAGKKSVNHTSTLLDLADTLYQAARKGTKTTFDSYATLDLQRLQIASLSGYYSAQLNSLNPAIFLFLTEGQKVQIEKQLIFTLYLYAAQARLDEAEARTKNLAASLQGINLCLKRLAELKRLKIQKQQDEKEAQLAEKIFDSEKYLKLLGLTILAPWLTSRMMEFISNGNALVDTENESDLVETGEVAIKESEQGGSTQGRKSTLMIEWMSAVNGRRLYWVWGGGMLASALELLAFEGSLSPEQIERAQKGLGAPSPVTGYMSWILYYTRFGINLILLLKHTINCSWWMSEEEAQIPAWERFKTQLSQRKFALLNDAIWATANMVCFFWLNGGGSLGYAGNVVTAVLLLMDLGVSIWAFVEESTRHNKEMKAFNKKKEALKEEFDKLTGLIEGRESTLEKLKAKIDDKDEAVISMQQELLNFKKRKLELEAELKHLNKTIKQSEMEWKYKKYGLINSMAYSAGLLFAFCLFCCFFFTPAAPIVALSLVVAGAALCFTLTILYAAVNGGLEIAKTKESIRETRADCKDLMILFAQTEDENMRKQLYLEMKSLMADSQYHEEMWKFQAVKLTRSIFVDAFFPALVFVSLVFMPMGMTALAAGFAIAGVIAAGLAIAAISHAILSRYEPQRVGVKNLSEFDEQKFNEEFEKFALKFDDDFPEAKTNKDFVISDSRFLEFFAEPKVEAPKKTFFSSNKGYVQVPESSVTAVETDLTNEALNITNTTK
ncbi:hypothetical protein [Legionella cardiaca]|uniref:Coiled-coil protein n=1 Tax=Legionella cardiaca TaxID=1071983 RepID=A0ABY8AQS9_9GAMM|nr:hypothetical protein [Legionella cardiaca]WED42794.1 hypothetical protein PXX05_12955 [Legionella cardiaca]